MNIKPFEDFIVVRPLEVKVSTIGKPRIQLSQKAKEESGMFDMIVAEVVEVGLGRMLECGMRRPMDAKKGDRIIFPMRCPKFPLAETELWQANGAKLPPLVVINIGHILGVVDTDVEMKYAEALPRINED